MKDDTHNCRHEAEQEVIDRERWEAHEDERCPGAPDCGYCLDEQAEIIAESTEGG